MRFTLRSAMMVAVALGVVGTLTGSVRAAPEQGSGVDPGRHCQIIKTCNFSRRGEVRGCLSSYSCRTCKLVPARCTIGNRTNCREFVCTWGG